MKVANVTDLKRFGEFVDDRIEDDDLLDGQEIAEIVAAIDQIRSPAVGEILDRVKSPNLKY